MKTNTDCEQCGKDYTPPKDATGAAWGIGTGYGTDEKGRRICYACCGVNDKAQMKRGEPIGLYLTEKTPGHHVATNWPGTLSINVGSVRESFHNIGGKMRAFNFCGPHGQQWYGRVCSQDSQAFTARRYKNQS